MRLSKHLPRLMRALFKSPMFIALTFVAACWSIMLHEVADFIYWNSHFKQLNSGDKSPPGDIVIVSLDGQGGNDQSGFAGTGRQAVLLERILADQPRKIYFDTPVSAGTDPAGDAAFLSALAAGRQKVTIVVRAVHDFSRGKTTLGTPRLRYPASTEIAISRWNLNFYGYAVSAPPVAQLGRQVYPSVAILQSGTRVFDKPVYPDFSIRPQAIPVVDAHAIVEGKADRPDLSGKTVFVTETAPKVGFTLGYVGHGRMPMAALDIAGGEGARKGPAIVLGSIAYLLLFMLIVSFGSRQKSRRVKALLYSSLVLVLLVAPALLYDLRIISSSNLGVLALIAYVPARLWEKWRLRVQLTNEQSGLPNIEALVAQGIPSGYEVLAASIDRYDEILASLPRSLHGECARQIARRLSMASGDRSVYANDKGQFVWLEEPRPIESMVDHLEGLRSLFSAPLVIGDHLLDTNIHFGLDRLAANPAAKRIQSALASSGEAMGKGKLYEEYEHQRVVEAPWELSLHARIDEGLRNGDIWLAFQGQQDIRTGRLCGAEALIRWSDPERGDIPPDAFILQAERAGRIETITYWVIERAIEALDVLSVDNEQFNVSINLSARMADHPALLERVGAIAARTGVDCSRVTFEVTETFSMANREVARRNLHGLREMGFRLSIDDFGTGQASLSYLAEIPSDEIKLDKRFIQAMREDRRERLIVRAVIRLAHALGQSVVAEGVEDEDVMHVLQQMNCDIAQGYHIARPMRLGDLVALIHEQRNSRAA